MLTLDHIKATLEQKIGRCFCRHKFQQSNVVLVEVFVESHFCWSEDLSDREILERVALDLEAKAAELRLEGAA